MYREEYVDTAIQTWCVAPPVSVGELAVWLKHGVVVQRERPTEWLQTISRVRAQDVAYLVASVLGHPLVRGSVRVQAQVGRFVAIEYQPLTQRDPTAVMTIILGAQRYHQAVLAFSTLANGVTGASWWYHDMRVAGQHVANELARLQPCAEEANLVMGWLLDRITYGEPRRNDREGFSW